MTTNTTTDRLALPVSDGQVAIIVFSVTSGGDDRILEDGETYRVLEDGVTQRITEMDI